MLGRAVRGEWLLDPEFLTVNHGSFGATPRVVLAEQEAWRQRMESQPTRFMSRVLPRALREAADRLGGFLGARGQDIVFTDNATTGCNAVLRSLRFGADDEILLLSHAYGAVRNTVQLVAERAGARVTEARLPFPNPAAAGIVAAVEAALTPRTRLAVIDHVTSASGLVIPVNEVVAACREAGVPVLVDGAHAPGQVDVDLTALGADWYTGNCHKWLCAPKGSAFLWAREERQADLHPTVISHGFKKGFLAEFDWTGTRDPTPVLCVPAALHFHARLGGSALRARNKALAAEAAELVAARLNSDVGTSGDQAGAMGLVRLPSARPADDALALAVRARLMDAGCDAPVHTLEGSLWLRLSVFAYNEQSDYVGLAEMAARVIRDI
jgi:isopenicillin-N epimerase